MLVARDAQEEPLRLLGVGTTSHAEWLASQQVSEPTSVLSEPEVEESGADADGEDEIPEDHPARTSVMAGVYARARAAWRARQRAAQMREEANAAAATASGGLLRGLVRAVTTSRTETEARIAAEDAAREAVAKRHRDQSARWLKERVKRSGGAWFPTDL